MSSLWGQNRIWEISSGHLCRLKALSKRPRFPTHSNQFREILLNTYQIEVDNFIASSGTSDCHRYFSLLAKQLNVHESYLLTEAARGYASECNRYEAEVLIEQLKDAGSR